jgi:hypothetical protein
MRFLHSCVFGGDDRRGWALDFGFTSAPFRTSSRTPGIHVGAGRDQQAHDSRVPAPAV